MVANSGNKKDVRESSKAEPGEIQHNQISNLVQ